MLPGVLLLLLLLPRVLLLLLLLLGVLAALQAVWADVLQALAAQRRRYVAQHTRTPGGLLRGRRRYARRRTARHRLHVLMWRPGWLLLLQRACVDDDVPAALWHECCRIQRCAHAMCCCWLLYRNRWRGQLPQALLLWGCSWATNATRSSCCCLWCCCR
jgi:hypothetical protein